MSRKGDKAFGDSSRPHWHTCVGDRIGLLTSATRRGHRVYRRRPQRQYRLQHGPDYISPMVHHRINEREANPNKHVNFITALPAPEVPSPYGEEDARQLLRALAAQVRPIMKSHGFEVNSLEEVSGYRMVDGQVI